MRRHPSFPLPNIIPTNVKMDERDKQAEHSKQTCCLNWFKIFLAALLPFVLGIFTIVFTLQQNSVARATREQDLYLAEKLRRETLFDNYINDISEFIISQKFNRNGSEY